jgi:hypothetical protein
VDLENNRCLVENDSAIDVKRLESIAEERHSGDNTPSAKQKLMKENDSAIDLNRISAIVDEERRSDGNMLHPKVAFVDLHDEAVAKRADSVGMLMYRGLRGVCIT